MTIINSSIKTAVVSGLAVTLIATSGAALADYPERPLTLIVPWAAGGGTDATARTIARALEEELGQNVNVVSRTGPYHHDQCQTRWLHHWPGDR